MLQLQCGSCGRKFAANPDEAGFVTCTGCQAKMNTYDMDFDLPAGFTLGGFEIIRLIGGGTAGKVYIANQLSMDRMVAIKVLRKNLTRNESALTSFLNEVKTLGQIHHANIVTAFEAGHESGFYYLVMQYVAGRTLEELIDNHRIQSQPDSLATIIKIAKALQFVWDRNALFHRDIKPGNIMICQDGEPVLLDMGIALRSGQASVENGEIEGSPYYMSPEQAKGEHLSWTTDLYSLGVTLYHMVVGVVPFDGHGDVMEIMRQHCNAPFPMPQSRNPGVAVSKEMTALLRRMMAKGAADRFSSWDEFIEDAEDVLKKMTGKGPAEEKDDTQNSESRKMPKISGKSTQKKKKLVVSAATAQKAARKRPKAVVSTMNLINTIIFIAIAAGGLFFFLQHRNSSIVKQSMDRCRSHLETAKAGKHLPSDVLKMFRQLEELADALFVKSALKQEAKDLCENGIPQLNAILKEDEDVENARMSIRRALRDIQDKFASAESKIRTKQNPKAELDAVEEALNSLRAQMNQVELTRDESKQKLQIEMGQVSAAYARLEKLRKSETPKQTNPLGSERAEPKEEPQATYKDTPEIYSERVSATQKQLSRSIIRAVRARNFEDANKAAVILPAMRTDNPNLRAQETAARAWVTWMQGQIARAQEVYTNLGENKATSDSIRQGASKSKSRAYSAYLLSGFFTDAWKNIPKNEPEENFNIVFSAVMTQEIEKAVKNAAAGDDERLKELSSRYAEIPVFQTVLKKCQSGE